jgi:hypothetical protein
MSQQNNISGTGKVALSFRKFLYFSVVTLLIGSPLFCMAQTEDENDTLDAYDQIMEPELLEPVQYTPAGQFWGSAFGDYAYKGNADNVNRGTAQYSGVPMNSNYFQWRRIYLGYNYDISEKFSAEVVMAAEADYSATSLGSSAAGDLLANNKFSPYIKLANLRWKNIWPGTDLVFGQVNTGAYGKTGRNEQTSEEVWGYRSLEKTVSDLLGTNCYDFGAELQGWFDEYGDFGYDLMMGNGNPAKPENDIYKWFYGDVYLKFFEKRLVIDLYQDYEKLNWSVPVVGPNGVWNHDRNTTKFFAAWNTEMLTVGFEGLRTNLLGDVKVTGKDGNYYYRSTNATGISFFARGHIWRDYDGNTKLGFFARYDNFDPSGDLSGIANDANTKTYTALTAAYDPTTKTQFMLLGLDYTPFKNVHIMPNLWMYTYNSALDAGNSNYTAFNMPSITGNKGTDAVWRLTFYYMFGK